MSAKEQLRTQLSRARNDLLEKGALVLKAPALIRGMECAIRFLLGAVLAQATIFGAYAPFGLGMVGASGSGLEGFCTLLGACLGYLSSLGAVLGLRYAASAILIYSVSFAFFDTKVYRSRWFMPLFASALTAATGFVYLSEGGWELTEVICFGSEILLTGGAVYVYRYAFSLWTDPGETLGPDGKQRVALLILADTLLIALAQVSLAWDISLGRALAALAVMAAAWQAGPAAGAAVGAGAGIAMDLSLGGLPPVYAMAYGFSGLLAGAVRRHGRLAAALSYAGANALAVLWAWGTGIPTAILYEVFAASVAFLMVPDRVLRRLEFLAPPPRAEDRSQPIRAYVQHQLEEQAAAFRGLYEQLRAACAPPPNDGDAAAIFDRTADRVCRGCALRSACWQRDYVTTFNALNDALPAMLERGRGQASDFPSHFSARCLRFADFLSTANGELTALLARRQYQARLRDSRSAVCRQYAELAGLLGTAAAELSTELAPDPVRERQLRAHLRAAGVDAEGAAFYDVHGRLRLEVQGADLSRLEGPEAQQALATALSLPLRPGRLTHVRGGEVMVFTQAEPMTATAGVAARRKDGQAVSGDAGTWFKGEDGMLWLALCDGMGAGQGAAADSKLALRLLEDFLRAGVAPEPALRTLSGALALRGDTEGGFTTIDLLQVDLFTGQGGVYKLGAAPTYLRRKGQVTRISGSALPAGLDPAAPPDFSRLTLAAGDLVVLVSDGVTDGSDDLWLRDALAAFQGDSPKELALSLLEQGPGGGTDDRTAIVLRLDERKSRREAV